LDANSDWRLATVLYCYEVMWGEPHPARAAARFCGGREGAKVGTHTARRRAARVGGSLEATIHLGELNGSLSDNPAQFRLARLRMPAAGGVSLLAAGVGEADGAGGFGDERGHRRCAMPARLCRRRPEAQPAFDIKNITDAAVRLPWRARARLRQMRGRRGTFGPLVRAASFCVTCPAEASTGKGRAPPRRCNSRQRRRPISASLRRTLARVTKKQRAGSGPFFLAAARLASGRPLRAGRRCARVALQSAAKAHPLSLRRRSRGRGGAGLLVGAIGGSLDVLALARPRPPAPASSRPAGRPQPPALAPDPPAGAVGSSARLARAASSRAKGSLGLGARAV